MQKIIPSNNKYFALRHGESEKNTPIPLVVSHPEPKPYHLTEKGKQQVRDAAKWLKDKELDMVFSSDLTRTKDTAELVAQELGLGVLYDERLRELDFGELNGRTAEAYHTFFDDHEDPHERFSKAPPGGETWQQVLNRMMEFLREVEAKYEGKNILIISHGDPLWFLEWGSQCLPLEDLKEVHYHEVGEPVELKITCPIDK